MAARVPDQLTVERHRDLAGRHRHIAARRVVLGLFCALVLAGLLDVFGQRPDRARASGPAASLDLYAPSRLRGGLIFEARFHIHAHRDLQHATLVLDPGWLEGITANSLEPSPVGESSRNGRIALDLGHIPAGRSVIFFMQLQVNPTNVGRRSQGVELDDGTTRLLAIHHDVTIFSLMDIVVRAAVAFLFVLVLTRALGKRELSALEPFDLILLVMLGDLVQQGVTQNDQSVTGLLLACTTIGLLTVATSYLTFRVRRLRPLVAGQPVILLQDGKVIEANLRRERITVEELAAEARLEQIASLEDVDWAILETTGKVSFIPAN